MSTSKTALILSMIRQSDSQIHPDIKAMDMIRLIDGDLSHIGDALVEGKEVECDKTSVYTRYRFNSEVDTYKVKPSVNERLAKLLSDHPYIEVRHVLAAVPAVPTKPYRMTDVRLANQRSITERIHIELTFS